MSDPLTPEELAELRRLDAEATPGPWRKYGGSFDHPIIAASSVELPTVDLGTIGSKADANYVVATRNALPRLLAEIERLRGENTSVREGMRRRVLFMEEEIKKAEAEIERLREELAELTAQEAKVIAHAALAREEAPDAD